MPTRFPSSPDLAACVPLHPTATRLASFPWLHQLRGACEILARSRPEVLAALSLTARLETAAPAEVDHLGEMSELLAGIHGLCVTVVVDAASASFKARFCRCPNQRGPHRRGECRTPGDQAR